MLHISIRMPVVSAAEVMHCSCLKGAMSTEVPLEV